MSNKIEESNQKTESGVERRRRIEPPPLPAEVLRQGRVIVDKLKDSGRPRVVEIVKAGGLLPEDQDIIDLTDADLIPLEEEANGALRDLKTEITKHPRQLVTPPPLPPEALSKLTRRSSGREARSVQETLEQLNERLLKETFFQIETKLTQVYEKATANNPDKEMQVSDVKLSLLELMGNLYEFSEVFIEGKSNNEAVVARLNNCLECLTKMRTHAEATVAKVFEDIFQEFGDIIDEQLVNKYIREQAEKGQPVSHEDATKAVYHRTEEEMEAIKTRNRVASVEVITQLATKDELTLEDIEALHMANNKRIVPKQTSHMRSKPSETVAFFKRFGLLPDQVEPAMKDVLERANQLIAKRKMSKAAYAIEAAKLHNDMLDIHPFSDRNGSTSMLFLETLMARRGYTPSPEREKKYYRHLKKVLGGNLIAMGVVGYQQVITAQVYGYYESPEIANKPELKRFYDQINELRKKQGARQNKEYKKALVAAKKREQARQDRVKSVPERERLAA